MSANGGQANLNSTWSPATSRGLGGSQSPIPTAKVDEAKSLLDEVQSSLSNAQEYLASPGHEGIQEVHEKLTCACRLLLGGHQDTQDLVAERDRYRDLLLCQAQKKLALGGTNIAAEFSTLQEIKADIEQTLSRDVSDWAEEALPKFLSQAAVLPRLLAEVFSLCHDLVEERLQKHAEFFLGGLNVKDPMSEMDSETAGFMLQHMRRHYRSLFPIAGDDLETASSTVINSLKTWVSGEMADAGETTPELVTGLETVTEKYISFFVHAKLQHPPVVFGNDVGEEQRFDRNLHNPSIDGDFLEVGQKCVVVFPASMQETQEPSGFRTLKYVLPDTP